MRSGVAFGALACLLASSVFAGCLSGESNDDGLVDRPLLTLTPQAGCDQPVFPGIRAREPDVAVDPADPSRVGAAAMVSIPSMRDAEPNGAVLAIWTAVARSADGGATWTWKDLPGWPGDTSADTAVSDFTGSALVGDPIVLFLPDGTLLHIGLQLRPESNLDLFAVRYTGDSLDPASYVTIARGAYGDPSLAQVPGTYQLFYNDKPEAFLDPATGDVYVGWMWRTNGASGSRAVPVVSVSHDGGLAWEPPAMLLGGLGAGAFADTFGPAVPFVSATGAHAVWWDQVAGAIWQADAPAGTLDFGAPRKVRDSTTLFGGDKGVLTSGLLQVAVGPDGQEVAVTWSQEGDGIDAVVIRSSDGGGTWSDAVAVGPLPGDQALPTVAFARDGTLAVHMLDNSEDPSGPHFRARLWATREGVTSELALASAAFDATTTSDQAQSVGDYHGLSPTADGYVAIWQDGRDGTSGAPFSDVRACRVVVG